MSVTLYAGDAAFQHGSMINNLALQTITLSSHGADNLFQRDSQDCCSLCFVPHCSAGSSIASALMLSVTVDLMSLLCFEIRYEHRDRAEWDASGEIWNVLKNLQMYQNFLWLFCGPDFLKSIWIQSGYAQKMYLGWQSEKILCFD